MDDVRDKRVVQSRERDPQCVWIRLMRRGDTPCNGLPAGDNHRGLARRARRFLVIGRALAVAYQR
jgi:hypothetical protein